MRNFLKTKGLKKQKKLKKQEKLQRCWQAITII